MSLIDHYDFALNRSPLVICVYIHFIT